MVPVAWFPWGEGGGRKGSVVYIVGLVASGFLSWRYLYVAWVAEEKWLSFYLGKQLIVLVCLGISSLLPLSTWAAFLSEQLPHCYLTHSHFFLFVFYLVCLTLRIFPRLSHPEPSIPTGLLLLFLLFLQPFWISLWVCPHTLSSSTKLCFICCHKQEVSAMNSPRTSILTASL
jgi:hypothetical protein